MVVRLKRLGELIALFPANMHDCNDTEFDKEFDSAIDARSVTALALFGQRCYIERL